MIQITIPFISVTVIVIQTPFYFRFFCDPPGTKIGKSHEREILSCRDTQE